MSTVLDVLHEDHRNVARLLELIGRELDALAGGSGGNLQLMRDAMTYMIHFPDHTHHPKEDLMFDRMCSKERKPAFEDEIAKLRREHGALARKSEAFRDALRRAIDGAATDRPALIAMGRDYVEFLGYHMRLEEETVFTEARTLLDDTDWAEITEAFEARTDPIFGPLVEAEYRALYQHIRNTEYLAARRRD